jgi:hypothetical protein
MRGVSEAAGVHHPSRRRDGYAAARRARTPAERVRRIGVLMPIGGEDPEVQGRLLLFREAGLRTIGLRGRADEFQGSNHSRRCR